MKGDIAGIGIADIVKALCMMGKSGRLTVTSRSGKGVIYIKSGNVINAEAGELRGEDALYALALKSSGRFHYEPSMTLVDRNVHKGSESLFIGLSSQVDRYHYLLSRSPGLDERLVAKIPEDKMPDDEEALHVLKLLKNPLTLKDVLKRSPYDRIRTLEIVSKYYTTRDIQIAGKSSTAIQEEPEEAEKAALCSLETNLKVISIGEVVQILVLIRRNGHLSTIWDDREGDVYVEQGNITFATVEQLEGLGALYRLLTWKDGYCKFFADVSPKTRNIQKNIESVFVEGIDILAKFNKFMDEFPSLNAFVDVIAVTGQETISEKEAKILKIVNENETLNDVIKHSPYSDVETLELTAKLYGQRMIGLSKGLRGQKEVDYDREAEDLLKDLL